MCAGARENRTKQQRRCVQVQEKILQRSSPSVCRCEKRSYNVAAQMCALESATKILQRSGSIVCKWKRRSYNVAAQVFASAREGFTM